MKRWFAVHCHARSEPKALFNLHRQGYEAYLPRYLKRRRHARRTDRVPAPLFPRYLFVKLDPEVDAWRPIQSTIGVSHLVCNGSVPMAVPTGIVESIRERQNEDGYVALNATVPFKSGEKVVIEDGPLVDQVGLFDRVSDDERVIVLLTLLGRSVEVRISADLISPAA